MNSINIVGVWTGIFVILSIILSSIGHKIKKIQKPIHHDIIEPELTEVQKRFVDIIERERVHFQTVGDLYTDIVFEDAEKNTHPFTFTKICVIFLEQLIDDKHWKNEVLIAMLDAAKNKIVIASEVAGWMKMISQLQIFCLKVMTKKIGQSCTITNDEPLSQLAYKLANKLNVYDSKPIAGDVIPFILDIAMHLQVITHFYDYEIKTTQTVYFIDFCFLLNKLKINSVDDFLQMLVDSKQSGPNEPFYAEIKANKDKINTWKEVGYPQKDFQTALYDYEDNYLKKIMKILNEETFEKKAYTEKKPILRKDSFGNVQKYW